MKKDRIRGLIGYTGNIFDECPRRMCNAPVCPVDSSSLVSCYTLRGEKYCPVALDVTEGKPAPEEIAEAVNLNMAAWRENVGESIIADRVKARGKVRERFGRTTA